MNAWDDTCEVVGCTSDPDTVVEIGDYGLRFEFCESHAENRVAEFEEMHYADE